MQPAQKKFLVRFVVALGAFYLLVSDHALSHPDR